VAAHAIGIGRGEGIVVVCVARGASGGGVGTDQSKTSGGVIESGVCPSDSVVALGAKRCWEARGDVIGDVSTQRCRAVPLVLVTAIAIGVR